MLCKGKPNYKLVSCIIFLAQFKQSLLFFRQIQQTLLYSTKTWIHDDDITQLF